MPTGRILNTQENSSPCNQKEMVSKRGVERKFRRYTTRSLSTRLKEGSNEERVSQVPATVVYSFVRDSFVFSEERESQPKLQTPGFLEENTPLNSSVSREESFHIHL
ncbi:hypothetical protein J6590_000977 [Homalodisca vitripennis]|nr:hypothetical protein J6590_000977 [Homalodisca vitripennis]